jgi:hypothetical protein
VAYTLAYLTSPVPNIPDKDGRVGEGGTPRARPPDRHEHFGTEEAALRRARLLFPASDWLDLRLYGPDGRLLATQAVIAERLGLDAAQATDNPGPPDAFEAGHTKGQLP